MESQGGTPPGVDWTVRGLAYEFPDWHFWRGVSGILYASRLRTSPPLIRRADTADRLREELSR